MENHRRTVHGMIEISKQRQTAVVNPTLKGKSQNVDYMPNTSSLGSLRLVFNFLEGYIICRLNSEEPIFFLWRFFLNQIDILIQ